MKVMNRTAFRIESIKRILFLSLIFIIPLLISSCKKDPVEEITITDEDAADLIASSVGTKSYGVTSSTSDATEKSTQATATSEPCLYSLDSNFTKTNPAGSITTFSYTMNYKAQMYCTSNLPSEMVFQLTSQGNLDMPRVSSSSTATGTLTLTNILPSSDVVTASGSYNKSGSATSKVRAKNSFSYQLKLDLSNLQVSKSTYAVESGTANVTLTATTSQNKSFNFTGTLTYVDANTATLVISGKTYTINITTSQVE